MFKKKPVAILVGAALFAPALLAQETKVDEHMLVSGKQSGYKADTNTTAMKIEVGQLETAGTVSVIDETIIDEQRASSLGDVLKNDASVAAGGDSRNRERFTLRGFDLNSSNGFLRDGKQHWSHYRQPIELLDRVEVLKGPSGLLYGQSSPAGLVNMVAKRPTYDTQVSVSQDLGSNNNSRTVADVSGALNDDKSLRARAVVAKQTKQSWRTYSDGSSHDTERFVGGLFVDYDINDDVTVSFHADKTRDHGSVDSGAVVVDGKVYGGDKTIWDAQWSKIENDVENYGFDIKANLNNSWTMATGFNYQDFRRVDVESSPKYSKLVSEGKVTHGGFDRRDHWVFQTGYVDFVGNHEAFGAKHQLLIGANWLGYSYDREYARLSYDNPDVEVGSPTPTPIKGDVSKSHSGYDSYGVYIQDMITFNEQWQALVGVRLDEHKSKGLTENAVSPKAAVIYKPRDNGSIYLTYSESFEAQGEVSGNYSNEGDKLDPLRGKQYELGTKWELMDGQLFVSGALFDIVQENSTIVEPGSGSSLDYLSQAGERRHRGAEVAAQGYVTDKLSLSGNAMYLDAEYTKYESRGVDYSGHRPADVPEFSASVWSRYHVTNSTDANLGAIYVGERYGDVPNKFKKDGYVRFDLGLAHTHKYDQNLEMVARLNVENLFDTDYWAGGDSDNLVIGQGRNFTATLQIKY
ncbi:TonB-dependent siderophore receptor [Vibrio sp. SCSIO 43136]|uniref:TonB-dependent siderophore receptor n=1 Tax=Vibrio sp. SCSIO 43136 TaxID=2819101 RepID=UPI002075FEAF|nr:TonB-dependent siderophore receptor [Vibrio sp. SCSIO 43136]USD67021.1 TonB-dependent siderophore receptor [Vibrio sp. SCSIO 43136]